MAFHFFLFLCLFVYFIMLIQVPIPIYPFLLCSSILKFEGVKDPTPAPESKQHNFLPFL